MKKILVSLALIVSINAFSQNWVKTENSSIKIVQTGKELFALKPFGVCTYSTITGTPAEVEAKANSFVASKTDIFVTSSELVVEYAVNDWGGSYPVYHWEVQYYKAFGKCY